MNLGILKLDLITAGNYKSDGGAVFGALPKAIWHKTVPADERNRITFALNLLLIRVHDRIMLVDTGCGNHLTEKQQHIYDATPFAVFAELERLGLTRFMITDLIITHLHFDHAGGIISHFDGKPELTFPQAVVHVQQQEWDMAKHPDELNRAAYAFDEQIALLEQEGKLHLFTGNTHLTPEVELRLTHGHTVGTQVVCCESEGQFAVYAGDIIPTALHVGLPVISAYDVSRENTFRAKKELLTEIRSKKGLLLFNHDHQQTQLMHHELV